MTCHLGDFEEYAALRRRLTDREKELARDGAARRRAARRRRRWRALKPGDVIVVPGGSALRRRRRARPGSARARRAAPAVLTHRPAGQAAVRRRLPGAGRAARAHPHPEAVQPALGQLAPRPRGASCKDAVGDVRVDRPRKARSGSGRGRARCSSCAGAIRQHPCHGCDEREEHARWAERYLPAARARRAASSAGSRPARTRSPGSSTGSARSSRGWATSPPRTTPPTVTDAGRMLQRLYNEMDLRRRRVPAAGHLGRAHRARAGRVRVRARVRVAPGRRRRAAEAARRPRCSDVLADTVTAVGRARRARGRGAACRSCASPTSASPRPPTAGRRGTRLESVLRDADLHGRRLRALVQAARRPARPDRRRRRRARRPEGIALARAPRARPSTPSSAASSRSRRSDAALSRASAAEHPVDRAAQVPAVGELRPAPRRRRARRAGGRRTPAAGSRCARGRRAARPRGSRARRASCRGCLDAPAGSRASAAARTPSSEP